MLQTNSIEESKETKSDRHDRWKRHRAKPAHRRSARRGRSSVELSIADTGAGISAEFVPYVFDRFRQEDGAMSRKAGGLGLGLAIVKHLVELHGGVVTVHSGHR
jgi:signal transduction histidine kinase